MTVKKYGLRQSHDLAFGAENHQNDDMKLQAKSGMSKSMHDGVEVWCDCCSCEAEPYWVDAMEDYEESETR